jgi:molybdopterin converting factor small subunit
VWNEEKLWAEPGFDIFPPLSARARRMRVLILLFASPKEIVGAASAVVELAAAGDAAAPPAAVSHSGTTTVAAVRAALLAAHPRLAGILPSCRFAVNQDLAEEEQAVREGDEVALVPPVSGG